MTEFTYNHDLLLGESDRQNAAVAFRNIYPALDFPDLRTFFAAHDEVANRMKRRSRSWGALAVITVCAALIGASAAHLFEHSPWAGAVGWASAVAGIAGAAIGARGVLYAGSKRRWLIERFITERLRQFYFQSLVAWAGDIAAAAASQNWAPYQAKRNAAFAALRQQLEAGVGSAFDLALRDNEGDSPSPSAWIIQSQGSGPDGESEAATELRSAYRHLRIEGQRSFAQHKLTDRRRIFSNQPVEQQRTLRTAGAAAIGLLVLLHLAVAVLIGLHKAHELVGLLHILAIWLAIAALAVRTFDEGLRPGSEVERYRAYRNSARNILVRFNKRATLAKALPDMREMEELCYDEMVSFLKSNEEARYAM